MKRTPLLLPGLLLLAATAAQAQFSVTTNNGAITIEGYSGPGGAVTIPTNIDGLPVTSIDDYAFDADPSLGAYSILISLTIPNSVTNIGEWAFAYCTTLTSVTIGDGVTSIGINAFSYCSNLSSVTMASSGTSIGDRAFKDCAKVTKFYFDDNAPTLGDEVFEGDKATICYSSGTSGWSSTFGGLPAEPCNGPIQTGLQVTILPAWAITAGAQWRVDSGAPENSGVTVAGLSAGSHTVSFTLASGWIAPADQSITIKGGATTTASGVYTGSAQPQVQWSKRIASTTALPSGEPEIGMALDSQGNCYVSGLFAGTSDFGGVTLTNESVGGSDIFVAEYNSSGVLQWARRAGDSSTNFDCARGLGVDNAGNVYVAGGFYGPAEFGSLNLPGNDDEELFLAKYDSTGTVQWVQRSVGGNGVYGTGLAVDGVGNCYALAEGYAATITFGTTTLTVPSDYDESTFLVKYDDTGTVQWAQLMGGTGETYATKVALDAAGNVYVCGSFESNLTIGTSNLVGSAAGSDMFIAKFDNSGALTWVQHTQGGNGGSGGVAVDQALNVYVASGFEGAINFSGISLTNAANDALVAKYSNSGAIQWARQAGGTSYNGYADVALDGQGNVYPAGFLSLDAAIGKYDPAGALQWGYLASGPPASPVSSLVAKCAVDAAGNCYLAGWYQGTATFGTTVLQPQGNWDFFLAKLAPPIAAGSLQVSITPAGAITAGAHWQVDGGSNENSRGTVTNLSAGTHTVSFTPISGWEPPPDQLVTITKGMTTKASGVYTQEVKGNPKLGITSPKSGQSVSNALFLVTGTVTDKVPVEGVYYRLNGGPWTLATRGNSWSSWTASVTLTSGANTISAYAEDGGGSFSPTNTVAFKYNPSVPNPFLAEEGTFNGLFLDTNNVTEASSGFFTLALATSGAFTGKIMTSGSTYSLPTTTPFDAGGQVEFTVPTKQGTLTFNLQLDVSDPASQQITGTVSDGIWTAGLTADRATFNATTNKPVNYEGLYTLAIAGNDDEAASPGGFGCATFSINPAGLITMAGNFADGTAMSQSVSVSKDGRWPFYAAYAPPPTGNGGAVVGWLTFSNQPASALGGTLRWFRPAGMSPAVYQSGFTNLAVPMTGSAYDPRDKPLLGLTNGQVTLAGGNLPFAITNRVTLSSNGTITVFPPNTNKLALAINKTAGGISGSFANPSNPKQTVKINGVLLQKQTNAVGYFLGASQSGAFLLENP